jgi:hypothetical protein
VTGSRRSRPARKCRCKAVSGEIAGARARTTRAAGPADRSPATGPPDALCRDSHTGAQKRLFDLFRGPHFTLPGLGERSAAALGGLETAFETALVKACLIGPGGLVDDAGHVARAYGGDALILIRPDGYIGLIADAGDAPAVTGYLRSL